MATTQKKNIAQSPSAKETVGVESAPPVNPLFIAVKQNILDKLNAENDKIADRLANEFLHALDMRVVNVAHMIDQLPVPQEPLESEVEANPDEPETPPSPKTKTTKTKVETKVEEFDSDSESVSDDEPEIPQPKTKSTKTSKIVRQQKRRK